MVVVLNPFTSKPVIYYRTLRSNLQYKSGIYIIQDIPVVLFRAPLTGFIDLERVLFLVCGFLGGCAQNNYFIACHLFTTNMKRRLNDILKRKSVNFSLVVHHGSLYLE